MSLSVIKTEKNYYYWFLNFVDLSQLDKKYYAELYI